MVNRMVPQTDATAAMVQRTRKPKRNEKETLCHETEHDSHDASLDPCAKKEAMT